MYVALCGVLDARTIILLDQLEYIELSGPHSSDLVPNSRTFVL